MLYPRLDILLMPFFKVESSHYQFTKLKQIFILRDLYVDKSTGVACFGGESLVNATEIEVINNVGGWDKEVQIKDCCYDQEAFR